MFVMLNLPESYVCRSLPAGHSLFVFSLCRLFLSHVCFVHFSVHLAETREQRRTSGNGLLARGQMSGPVSTRKFLRPAISTQVFLAFVCLQANTEMASKFPVASACISCSPPGLKYVNQIRGGAHKSLAFPISYFPICSTTKRIFGNSLR
jgi:hypothetical protein